MCSVDAAVLVIVPRESFRLCEISTVSVLAIESGSNLRQSYWLISASGHREILCSSPIIVVTPSAGLQTLLDGLPYEQCL